MGKYIVSYRVEVAKAYGINVAIVYDRVEFWSDKGQRPDGWVYKSYEDMAEETALSPKQIRLAYNKLIERGVIETKVMKVNDKPTLHFRKLPSESDERAISESDEREETRESDEREVSYNIQEQPGTTGSLQKVRELFDLYVGEFGATKTILTIGRTNKLKARLKTYGFDMVAQAIRNTAKSSFHRGDNDRNWKADLDFIIRNDEQVERMANLEVGHRFTQQELNALVREQQTPGTTRERVLEISRIMAENKRRYGNN